VKTSRTVALSLAAGSVLGAIAFHALHAQSNPPVYYIAEVDVTNQGGYLKEFAPKAQAAVKASGGRFLVQGGKTTPLLGDPPKSRIIVQQWDSLDALQKWFNSPEQTELRKIQQQYAKVRVFAVEGVGNK
jgi:uncharacterized protein (DUF1330 family)